MVRNGRESGKCEYPKCRKPFTQYLENVALCDKHNSKVLEEKFKKKNEKNECGECRGCTTTIAEADNENAKR